MHHLTQAVHLTMCCLNFSKAFAAAWLFVNTLQKRAGRKLQVESILDCAFQVLVTDTDHMQDIGARPYTAYLISVCVFSTGRFVFTQISSNCQHYSSIWEIQIAQKPIFDDVIWVSRLALKMPIFTLHLDFGCVDMWMTPQRHFESCFYTLLTEHRSISEYLALAENLNLYCIFQTSFETKYPEHRHACCRWLILAWAIAWRVTALQSRQIVMGHHSSPLQKGWGVLK